MDENRLPFDLVKDEIVPDYKNPITHRSQLVIARYSPEIGMTHKTLYMSFYPMGERLSS